MDGSSALAAPVPVVGGTAYLVSSALTTGTHSLTARFTPTDPAAFASSSSPSASMTVRELSVQTIIASLQRFLQSILRGPHS
jgi:hypothetical protein